MDLSYLLDYGGVFEPLRDPGFFAQLRADAEASTIVWPNDADIAPETLYEPRSAGLAVKAIVQALTDRDEPMRVKDIRAAVEALVGETVPPPSGARQIDLSG